MDLFKMLRRIVLITCLVSNTSAQVITPISEGTPAKFSGFLIDREFEQARRKEAELLKIEEAKNITLKQLGVIHEGRVDFYKKEAEIAKSEVIKQQWKSVLYFIGGVVLGGASLYLGSKVTP